jgi:hypothetical protein
MRQMTAVMRREGRRAAARLVSGEGGSLPTADKTGLDGGLHTYAGGELSPADEQEYTALIISRTLAGADQVPGASTDNLPIQAENCDDSGVDTHKRRNRTAARIVRQMEEALNGVKCYFHPHTITPESLNSYLHRSMFPTWYMAREDHDGPSGIYQYLLGLAQRGVLLGWPEDKILSIVALWIGQNDLHLGAYWPNQVRCAIVEVRRTTKPKYNIRPKASTDNWVKIEACLAGFAIMKPADIAECTGLEPSVVKTQLDRKRRLGWVIRAARGKYARTPECGRIPVTPRRSKIQPYYLQETGD